jgi:hypothetical protein
MGASVGGTVASDSGAGSGLVGGSASGVCVAVKAGSASVGSVVCVATAVGGGGVAITREWLQFSIQNLPNFSRKATNRKGFLQKTDAFIQNTIMDNNIICISGHIQYFTKNWPESPCL